MFKLIQLDYKGMNNSKNIARKVFYFNCSNTCQHWYNPRGT